MSWYKALLASGVCVIGVSILIVSAFQLPSRLLRRPDLLQHQGQLWLSWTGSERESYVLGYIEGYGVGGSDACLSIDRFCRLEKPQTVAGGNVPSWHPSALCSADIQGYDYVIVSPSSGVNVSGYTAVITKFYMQHPDLRDTLLLDLMRMLRGPKKVTADDLYSRLTHP